MESQSLIASRNVDSEKHKKGYATLLATVSTAILLFGLAFYGGVYHRRRGGARVQASVVVDVGAITHKETEFSKTDRHWGSHRTRADDVIPFGGNCLDHRDNIEKNCVIPLGLQHGVCYCNYPCEACGQLCECQSGQPDARCDQTSDCVVPPELEHAVCRDDKCQSGQPGASCGVHDDCVAPPELAPKLNRGVCRDKKCQSGQSGARCEKDSECVVPSNLDHGVCRGPTKRCQRGVKKDYCSEDRDCLSGRCKGGTAIAKCK